MSLLLIENAEFKINEADKTTTILTVDEMEINKYGCYGLKAPNGTGKTTFFNCLFKKNNYDMSGYVSIKYVDITSKNFVTTDMFSNGCAFLQQNNIELPNVTYKHLLQEIININKISIFSSDEISNNIVIKKRAEAFGIDYNLLNKEIGICSSGERKVLDLFFFSLLDMNMIFIDELDANLDQENKKILINFIKTYKTEKMFFIISHDKKFLDDCECDTFFTIKRHRIVKVRKSDIDVI